MMKKIIIHPNAFQEYLDSSEGKQVRKIFFDGENYEFLPGSLHCSENREKVDSQHYFYIYVTTKKIQQDLQQMNSMPSIIESIEALQERVKKLEQSSSTESASLKGIVTLEPDEEGAIGLEIPGLLSINNRELGPNPYNVLSTEGNLCLMVENAEVLQINSMDNTLTANPGQNRIDLYLNGRSDQGGYSYYDSNHRDYSYRGNRASTPNIRYKIDLVLDLINVPIESNYLTFDTIFRCSYHVTISNHSELKTLNLDYSNSDSSSYSITVPITVTTLNVTNFSGVIDVHQCNSEFLIMNLFLVEGCESGTLLISPEQHDIAQLMIHDGVFRTRPDAPTSIHVRVVGGEDQ